MAIEKKYGKGRLDKWYNLAKEKGYRARAAFKLIQINKKYNFLQNAKVCVDLCAAPGSWCQVASEVMPVNSLIIGVDLAPIKPISKVITFQSDITTEKCRATIRGHLKTWKADVVLHDGAPNVGTAWVQDAFTQSELVLQSLKLATEFLMPGGTFVTKVFRSRDFNNLMWVFNQLFNKVEATKPPSSRNVSAEIFVVCRGFKAPKKIDPKFLDPQTVFEELPDAAPNNEAKVFRPEKKRRHRGGYEEGDYLLYKEQPIRNFIETTDPIQMLGTVHRLSFEEKENGDLAIAAITKLPETTSEIRACCEDLRVLGKKDFRKLLKWRLAVREKFGLAKKKQLLVEEAQVEPMDGEMQIEEDLQRMKDREAAEKKRQRRKENEKKTKEIVRMQLHMGTPMEIGMEQDSGAMFGLKTVDKAGPKALSKLTKGKMNIVVDEEVKPSHKDVYLGELLPEEGGSEDETEDRLEAQLDELYARYQERKSESDAKFKARKARKDHEDGEWTGFSEDEANSDGGDDDDELVACEESSDDESEEDADQKSLVKRLDGHDVVGEDGLSKRAALFFDQDIFADIEGEEEEEEEEDGEEVDESFAGFDEGHDGEMDEDMEDAEDAVSEAGSDDDGFEIVKTQKEERWDGEDEAMKDGRPDIEIITAEAMSLAQQLVTGQKTKHDLIDDGFNKWTFRDRDGLPEWFLDSEDKYARPIKPITAAGAAAIKEKLRALNARPIKKVAEAKARKKYKAAQRMEKLRKKSALLAEDEGMTEKDKAQTIGKMIARAAKKKPKTQVKVVVARGVNKGQGRPRGVKGRYKIVDARLKKDVRAQKRAAKKIKKR